MKKACHRHLAAIPVGLPAIFGNALKVKPAVTSIRIKSLDLQGFFSASASSPM